MANVTYIAPVKAECTIHKIRCAAYCRVSSSSEDQLHSYAAQVKFYSEKFIGSETEELVDIYADEGISGTGTAKRTEFQRLIRDGKRGKIDRIYAKSLSRFARNTKDCLNTVRLLRELGISIYFEKENIDTAKTNDELMITVMGSLAQEESTSISQNMRWSVRKRMENGTYESSVAPYGYIKKNGKLVVDPSKSKIVKKIYEWYLSGIGLSQIAIELNENGIPPIRQAKKWYIFNIEYILKNEKYIGNSLLQKTYYTDTVPYKKIKNNGERDKYLIIDSHEAIISKDDFNKVQKLLSERENKYYNKKCNKAAFRSVIKCGICGRIYKRKRNNGIYYWSCTNHDNHADNCKSKPIPEETIKQAFVSMCNKLILHYKEILLPLRRSLQELNMRRFSGNTKLLEIHKNIAEIKEQRYVLSRLRKKGFMDEKKYNEKLTELESQLSRQEREMKKITKADKEDDTLEQLDILTDSIEKQDNITTEFDEELFGIIVERIIVRDKSLEFILISGLSLKEDI
jgi:DNA invertase Pin-like site-specific DNA recombinase